MKGTKRKGLRKNKDGNDAVRDALIKKALGYDAKEVTEEYSKGEDGEIVLTKKKVTIKSVPPDVTALKILFESDLSPIENMTDEELLRERDRLLKLLAESDITTTDTAEK